MRLATTVPLFVAAFAAWLFDYTVLALLCGAAGLLLAVLQWMTIRALLHNASRDGER